MPQISPSPQRNCYDVIVVGLGSMGSAACWHLARRGLRVLGLERHALVHEFGAHHGRARMIRQAYFEHPDYVPLIRRAYHNWDELGEVSGQQSLYRTGGLYLGPPDGIIVAGSLVAARQHQLDFEMLDREALGARFPIFQTPPDMVGFFETEAGYLIPETAVASHLEAARAQGAELRDNEAVLNWRTVSHGERADSVAVKTDHGTYHADHLILSAGAWTASLLADLNIDLRVTRQVQAWFQPTDPLPFCATQSNFPCWFIETHPPYGHYGFPLSPDGRSVKIARHEPGSPTTAQQVDRRVANAETDALLEIAQRYLPAAAGPLSDASVCLYTNSPDGHFIIDRHPDHPQVSFGCGFSGHGFKFASVIGEALADLASAGMTELPIGFLGLDRLR